MTKGEFLKSVEKIFDERIPAEHEVFLMSSVIREQPFDGRIDLTMDVRHSKPVLKKGDES